MFYLKIVVYLCSISFVSTDLSLENLMAMNNNTMNTSPNINTQESLQPQRITPEDKAYQGVRDIEERLRIGDATNIALTGPYGSGKSSILISLKADYPEYNYLNISLATLESLVETLDDVGDEHGDKENGEMSKENLDRLIEYSILQQLVYRESQDTLPNSRLKRIFHLSSEKIRNISMAMLGSLAALIILFEPSFFRVEWLCELLGRQWLNIIGDTVSIIYLSWFVYKSIQKIVPAISNSRLNKLNLKSGEIEIVKNTSIFNKHLDEILYFFEQTMYNVVIIEDLDRFKSTAIFLKLRELNLLLNESKIVGRKIFFIYAVRDDLFVDADRVKCFDYITTVIPVINRSNAKNQLKAELEKRGVIEINDKYLGELGFFLYDMRLLKNIANEYVQYRGKLANGISPEKLLAMVLYKNFYPKDFALLHDCKGVVYQLINLKDSFVASKLEQLEMESVELQEQRKKHLKEKHLKESELRQIYVDAYRERVGNTMISLKVGNDFHSIKEIATNESLFMELIKNSNVTFSFTANNGYYSGRQQTNTMLIPFSQIEKDVDIDTPFSERLKALRNSFEGLDEATNIEKQKDIIRSQSISQILNEVDYSSSAEYKALNVPSLIEFLVVKGYIDENYYDYISYFYDNFIDAHDWDFILAMKLYKTQPYEFHVNNVEACLTEIPYSVYQKKAILNIDIVNYLAMNWSGTNEKKKMLAILRTIIEGNHYDFLATYYQKGRCQEIVFSLLFYHHRNLWSSFDKYDDYNHELKLIWFKYAEMELSCDESRRWLSKHYAFITESLLDVDSKQWCMLIHKHSYHFEQLNTNNNDILEEVTNRNAYVLNENNVEALISSFLNFNCDSASYTLVFNTNNNALIERVNNELAFCLHDIFSRPECKKESVEAIVKILEAEGVSETDKIAYLSNQQNPLNLDLIDSNEIKMLALKCDVVDPSWQNVINYMKSVGEGKTDEILTSFVERHVDSIASFAIPEELNDDEGMLMNQFVETDSLSFDVYKKVLEHFTELRFIGGVPSVEEKKMFLLIEKGMVPFMTNNTQSILQRYSAEIVVRYCVKNKRDYLKKVESVEYTTEIAYGLMKSELSTREKALIIPCFNKEILSIDLANEIIGVLNLIEIEMDKDFLLKAMRLATMTDKKIRVLNYTLNKNTFDEDTITLFLKTLSLPYKTISEKGKKPELPNNEQVKQLLHILKLQCYISSYSEHKNGIKVYTKMK